MAAIFGASTRAHLFATLTQLLQLPGKAGKASQSRFASFNPHAEGWDVFDCGFRDDGSPRVGAAAPG